MTNFYEMAVKLIGDLPSSSLWIYDLGAIFLVICAFCLFVIPCALIFKRITRL